MALFKKKESKESYFSTATIITKGTHTVGNIVGNDSIHIEGEVHGDVKINNVVIITAEGAVHGNIRAKQIISSGSVHGNMLCDTVELLEGSRTSGKIKSNKILIKGRYEGEIRCAGLFVDAAAMLHASIEAKNVVVGGETEGTIVCRELKITPTGRIRGKTFAERILNQGGHVEGFIGRYSELVRNNPGLLRYAHIFSGSEEAILLSYQDYYVDVEEELRGEKGSQEGDDTIDTDFYTPERSG